MAKEVARDLEDLGSSIGEVMCTFIDITLHAMFPLVNDPYFGDLFIGFRLIISFFVWAAFIISAGYLVTCPCERIAERKRGTAEDNNADQGNEERHSEEESDQALLDKLDWRKAQIVSPEEMKNARGGSKRNGLVASICALPRGAWNVLRRVFLSGLLCFWPAPGATENGVPYYIPSATEEKKMNNVVIPMGESSQPKNSAAELGCPTENQDLPKELKNLLNNLDNNKIKIMGKELKLNNIVQGGLTSRAGRGNTTGKPGPSVQITYNFLQMKDDEGKLNNAE